LKLEKHEAGLASRNIAPITGARIETDRRAGSPRTPRASPPSRGRGLKPVRRQLIDDIAHIAPITGARIETSALLC